MNDRAGAPSGRPGPGRVAWALGAISALYLAYLAVVSVMDAGGPREVGYVVGSLAGVLGLALAIRFVYARVRRAPDSPAFWSPWIVVIAAALMLLSRISRLGGS